ncbi:MAG: hypothetical protein JWO58_1001 [Chitinophagaceae bacterium]|nr:hypothetical protein [Chitinophagaceae bacterium]
MLMKKLFLAFAILCGSLNVAHAQLPVDQGTGKITYLEVVDAAGVKAADLNKVVKEWATKQGFALKEEAGDKLVYAASTAVEYPAVSGTGTEKGKVNFSLSVFCKEGKYRYILTDFVHEGDVKTKATGGKLENVNPDCGATKMSGKGWVTIKNKTGANMKVLTDDLKRVIKEYQNDPANKTDW